MKTFTVKLEEILVEASDSDDTLLKKAQNHLPKALKRLGEKAGEEAWATLERGFRNSSLIKLNKSSSDKAKFVQNMAKQFADKSTSSERQRLVQTMFEQIQKQRDDKRDTKA